MSSTVAWGSSLRALRSRNYRLFFAGQSVSLIGTWMTRLAMSWIIAPLIVRNGEGRVHLALKIDDPVQVERW
jgi:hypothetical protein